MGRKFHPYQVNNSTPAKPAKKLKISEDEYIKLLMNKSKNEDGKKDTKRNEKQEISKTQITNLNETKPKLSLKNKSKKQKLVMRNEPGSIYTTVSNMRN